jgi:Domain of unknown function (DUF1857)
MIEMSTDRIPVNPPGSEVRLTRDDVWRGLMWKAEVPMPFVEPIVDCEILERFDDGFLREIQHLTPSGVPEPIQERIILDPQQTVTFLRLSGGTVGRIINEIVEDSGELFLQFHFVLGLLGVAHRSPQEDEYRAGFARGYLSAVSTTLEALREMVRTGVDPTVEHRAAV